MKDRFGRTIEYMRVSITDRCDLRCRYCMPEGCEKVPMSRILSYEDIVRICKAAAGLGISRIKITGGEPFVRLGCTDLMRAIKAIEGIEEVTVTTNGQSLARHIRELREIGIDGINISLDSLDAERFRYITGGGDLAKTLEGLEAAVSSGIKTKVNCLLQKGFNEDELYSIAALSWEKDIDVRFIEMMPIGLGDPGRGISNEEVLTRLLDRWPELSPDTRSHGNGPAVYYRLPGRKGAIGLISALHGPFCGSCNRIRLTSQGLVKPCLFYEEGRDIRPFLQGSEEDLMEALRDTVLQKPEGHRFNSRGSGNRTEPGTGEKRLMSQIGG